MTRLAYTIDIDRPPEDVFDVVADPRNDHRWCERVGESRQTAGTTPAVGARYEIRHHPSLHRPHTRRIEIVELDRPRRVVSLQDDRVGRFTISYDLEPAGAGATRLTQRDEIEWRVPWVARPLARTIVNRHIGGQLRVLKALLERDG